ncbi:MAG: hypothetical protein U1E28_16790 [Beijerinckiaceae bacterium]
MRLPLTIASAPPNASQARDSVVARPAGAAAAAGDGAMSSNVPSASRNNAICAADRRGARACRATSRTRLGFSRVDMTIRRAYLS